MSVSSDKTVASRFDGLSKLSRSRYWSGHFATRAHSQEVGRHPQAAFSVRSRDRPGRLARTPRAVLCMGPAQPMHFLPALGPGVRPQTLGTLWICVSTRSPLLRGQRPPLGKCTVHAARQGFSCCSERPEMDSAISRALLRARGARI